MPWSSWAVSWPFPDGTPRKSIVNTFSLHRHATTLYTQYMATGNWIEGLNKLTFVEMVTRFPTEAAAITFLEAVRWQTGPYCFRCGCTDVSRVTSKRARPLWYCKGCKSQFTITPARRAFRLSKFTGCLESPAARPGTSPTAFATRWERTFRPC